MELKTQEVMILVGLSKSGKTKIAKRIADTTPNSCVISLEDMKDRLIQSKPEKEVTDEEIFNEFYHSIVENVKEGHTVIVDAPNITIEDRKKILDLIKDFDIYKSCMLILRSMKDCKKENEISENPVPKGTILKQYKEFQVPFMEEGFKRIYVEPKYPKNNIAMDDMMYAEQFWYGETNLNGVELFNHSMETSYKFYNLRKYEPIYALGAMFHDYGKIKVQKPDEDGNSRYHNHSSISAYELISSSPKAYMLKAAFLANYHMLPYEWTTEEQKEKWKKIFGEEKFQMLLDFHECDK